MQELCVGFVFLSKLILPLCEVCSINLHEESLDPKGYALSLGHFLGTHQISLPSCLRELLPQLKILSNIWTLETPLNKDVILVKFKFALFL